MKTLQIVVTEKCNLSCSYCYMNNRNTFMTRETFVDFYESLPFNQKYEIDLFGGEPLMNWDVVKFIIETVHIDDRFGKTSIISNGLLLTQEMVDFIKSYSVSFHWSCDGIVEEDLQSYINKADLLKQLCSTVSVVVTPDNLGVKKNYNFFMDNFNMTPNFSLVKTGWDIESIELFKDEYFDFINFLITKFREERISIPKNIVHDIVVLFEGIKKKTPKRICVDSDLRCLMPDSSVGFCAMKCTNGDTEIPSDFGELYSKCDECEITNFCGKGCYEDVRQNGGVNDNMCSLIKFMLSQSIRLNHELKYDGYWTNSYIKKIFDGYKGK